ncbi:relaxin-3-like [Centroberyx affinis]|uniref:relaxin-3-like n=1 Tax=Centroberyx affinis TaxID=166261 RepID=UPI003A5BFC62
MWKAVVLAVCLLVAGVQAMEGPTYGVKLCGREFIRAVIFTCGGSRWRRSLRSAGELSEDPFSPREEESSEGWSQDSVVEGLFQRTGDLGLHSQPRDGQEGVFSRPARSFISEEILEALRKADRKGRDVVVGLSNACCKWGCSKSEISSLC